MGAYLSHPKVDKASTDDMNDTLDVGASSMQGWRNSQEDAHNAILNFDKGTSFFAVYDGHGGAEVAQYCADKLPDFLKELIPYKNDEFEKALTEAFLGFDKTLLEPQVVNILKILAGERNFVDVDDSDAMEEEDDDEDLEELHEEGHLPLDQLLGKYKGHPDMPELMRLKENAVQNSKPQSPYLRGRRAAAIAAEAANKEAMDPDAKPQGSSTSAAALAGSSAVATMSKAAVVEGPSSSKTATTKLEGHEPEDDSTVSSSSSSGSKTNNNSASNANDAVEAEVSAQKVNGAKTEKAGKDGGQNGSVTSSEAKIVKADVSTSSAGESKVNIDDATVSGSSDAASASAKQNGSIASSTVVKAAERPDISSTSKEAEKGQKTPTEAEEDEDDADYVADKSNIEDPQEVQEYSSDDEIETGEYDEDDDDDDDEDDDDDAMDEERLANDQFCANMIEEPGKDSGCTAVVSLLHGRDLYVANAGDSRCVVCRNGKAIDMSLDHKPEDDKESFRIVKAGGRVTVDGRVNGGLNLSRAIGDHAYKMNADLPAEEQMISAMPDIKKLIVSPEDEFMVLACDGIWNYMSSEEVVDFVRVRLQDESKKLSQICEELFDNCLAPNTMGDGTGCDNMTAVIVRFKPKIIDLETKINVAETEDVLLTNQAQKALKRGAPPASPDELANEAENANKSKRLKTDDAEAISAKSITAASTSSNDSTASSSTPSSAEMKECDSINIASNDTIAEPVVVSST